MIILGFQNFSKSLYKFRIGSTNLQEGGELFDISDVFIHPTYDASFSLNPLDYDFSIVRLANPVELSNIVGIIKLPDENDETAAGEMCLLTGWGSNSQSNAASEHLMGVHIPFVDTESCKKSWDSLLTVADHSLLTDRMICAGEPATSKIVNF